MSEVTAELDQLPGISNSDCQSSSLSMERSFRAIFRGGQLAKVVFPFAALLVGILGSAPSIAVPFSIYAIDNTTDELVTLTPPADSETSAIERDSIGLLGFNDLNGLAYDSSTDAFFSADRDSGQLVRIDRASGVGTGVGSIGLGGELGFAVQDLTFGPNNTLFGLTNASGSTSKLISIDKVTGQGALVGGTSAQLDGLAFQPNSNKMFATDRFFPRFLYEVDPNTGNFVSTRGLESGVVRAAADPNSTDLFAIRTGLERDVC